MHPTARFEALAATYNHLCATLDGPDRAERLAALEAEMLAAAEACKGWEDKDMTTTEKLYIRCMAGSCRNGFERDAGTLYHAVMAESDPSYMSAVALCGRRPGRRSAGWSRGSAPGITCPRCQKKAAELRSEPVATS